MRGLGGILVGYTLRYLAQAGETGRQATGGFYSPHLPPRIHKHHQRYPDRLGVLSHWATTVSGIVTRSDNHSGIVTGSDSHTIDVGRVEKDFSDVCQGVVGD